MLLAMIILCGLQAIKEEPLTECAFISTGSDYQTTYSLNRRTYDDIASRQLIERALKRSRMYSTPDFFPEYSEYLKRAKKIATLRAELDEIGRKAIELRRDTKLSTEEKEKLNSMYRQRVDDIERELHKLK
jgi:hypothetical protein